MKRAVSYLRVSSRGQIDGDGFDRQREAIERYAKASQIELVGEFRDEGVSGTTALAERPGLVALTERMLDDGPHLMLIEKADRLARDLVQGELILRELRQMRVRVVEAEGGADLTKGDASNPTATLVRQVLGAVAEFEKSALVAKLRAARQRKRARGDRCEGQRPFGWTAEEKAVLDRMKQLNRKPRGGKRPSCEQIAKQLNEEGLPTRSGKPWSRGSVWAILRRP